MGAVSYLNAKPLLYGIRNHPVVNEIELSEDYPAAIAQQLIDGSLDVGLVPVAAIPHIPNAEIITDCCIGCDGPVASVCIFSEVPMTHVETVLLDYQSRTSVNLARILLKEYWKCRPRFVNAAGEDYRQRISGTTAGVVIGDRALEQRTHSAFIYDLGEAWKTHTSLPFVFAAWVSNKKLPADFNRRFNEANAFGLQHIDEVVRQNPFPHYDLKEYFTSRIQYRLTPRKEEGMRLFLQKLKTVSLQANPINGQ